LKECKLEACQTLGCVGDPLKKLAIGDKTKPLDSQNVGPTTGQLVVIGFEGLVMRFGTGKC
jgi:hypothetical protein